MAISVSAAPFAIWAHVAVLLGFQLYSSRLRCIPGRWASAISVEVGNVVNQINAAQVTETANRSVRAEEAVRSTAT